MDDTPFSSEVQAGYCPGDVKYFEKKSKPLKLMCNNMAYSEGNLARLVRTLKSNRSAPMFLTRRRLFRGDLLNSERVSIKRKMNRIGYMLAADCGCEYESMRGRSAAPLGN